MGFPVLRFNRWPVVLPLHDGRACPDCGAVVIGRGPRIAHRNWHVQRTEFDTQLFEAVRVMAEYGGHQGNDEEDNGIMKHDRTSCGGAAYIFCPCLEYARMNSAVPSAGSVAVCRTWLTPARWNERLSAIIRAR